jgi:hypothetical protein
VLPVLAILALLAVAIPLTVTGLGRVGRSAMDWRREATTTWHNASGVVDRVRNDDGMVLDVAFRDRHDDPQRARVFVGDASGKWIDHHVRIRYESGNPSRIELRDLGDDDPISALLLAGAPLGAGLAGLVLAVVVWRRRRRLWAGEPALEVVRSGLVAAGGLVVAGVASWAVGTVWERGWSAVASSAGHLGATVFGDLLGVLVPMVAFVLGCLVTAWLARHRHHDDHDGLVSSAYRMIDKAAGMAPSPEEMRPDAVAAEETPVP